MGNEFLYKEYELNFEQQRFYDSRHANTFRYLFTLTSSVAVAQFALYKFFQSSTPSFFKCHLFLSVIVFVATALLFVSMLQNRLYFVFTTRQLNAIRKYLLEKEAAKFKDNQLYTSKNFPAIKRLSVHTLQLIGAALISSMFAASSMYSLLPVLGYQTSLCLPIFILIIIFSLEIISGYAYLEKQGKKSADEAIHAK